MLRPVGFFSDQLLISRHSFSWFLFILVMPGKSVLCTKLRLFTTDWTWTYDCSPVLYHSTSLSVNFLWNSKCKAFGKSTFFLCLFVFKKEYWRVFSLIPHYWTTYVELKRNQIKIKLLLMTCCFAESRQVCALWCWNSGKSRLISGREETNNDWLRGNYETNDESVINISLICHSH